LDLVEVAPAAKPPVCKILNYSKYRYEQEKQDRQQRAKGKAPDLKEVRLSLKIGEHDLEVKAKRAKEFLEKGSKVRVMLQLRGREMIFKDKALEMLDHFRDILDTEYEQAPARLGNRFNAILKLKRGKNAKIENS
jgi:translation initiation factor IF-3